MGKKEFFEKLRAEGIALTYDDVRLKTGYSKVMPDEVDISSKFSRNVYLKIPIVSAAMDTITEHALAIELAKLGGIGVIHKNLTAQQQADEVARVKHHLNGLIDAPITVHEDELIKDILEKRKRKGYSFHTFPVVNNSGRLVGILSKNDFDFCINQDISASQIMSRNLISAPEGTTLYEAYELMLRGKKKVLPLISIEGKLAGMYVFSDVKRIKTGSSKDYNVDSKGRLRVAAAIGVLNDAFERLNELTKEDVDLVVIDTAHGDSQQVIETLKEIKKRYSNLDVVVGNVSEPESVKRLIEAGADGIKVGQGPGSICTTRIIAGIGCPQVTAIYNCVQAAEGSGVPICADGGLTYSGDITIAIGTGAHSVMLGRMFAGTKETPGELVFREGRQWKSYRGMGSIGAMELFKGSRERYNQTKTGKNSLIPEGVEGLVPYQGELAEVILQYIGGLRRGMGYVGAATIEELRQKAEFHRISTAGQNESHPHGLLSTKDPPNYPGRI